MSSKIKRTDLSLLPFNRVILTSCVLLFCGCTSTNYRGWQEEKFSVNNELQVEAINPEQRVAKGPIFIHGRGVGVRKVRKKEYECYQFRDFLRGDARILSIYVDYVGKNVILTDKRPEEPPIEPAALHVIPANVPSDVLRGEYRKKIEAVSGNKTVVVLSVIGSDSEIYVKVYKDGKYLFTTKAKVDLEWKYRSFEFYILSHVGYVVTVPIDIVSFPFQLFFVIKGM